MRLPLLAFVVVIVWLTQGEWDTGPNEVLIRLNCTGICHSDIHFMKGEFGYKLSSFGVKSPGHEGAGVIVKVGDLVRDWKVGDRAGIKPMWTTCQNCELCWNDREGYCPKRLNSGMRVTGEFTPCVEAPHPSRDQRTRETIRCLQSPISSRRVQVPINSTVSVTSASYVVSPELSSPNAPR